MLLALAGKSERSIQQHEQIIDAFKKRDVGLSEKLVIENALAGKEVIVGEILQEMKRVV